VSSFGLVLLLDRLPLVDYDYYRPALLDDSIDKFEVIDSK
jgi:hypothetical protein